MKKKIFYWAPHFSKIATNKAVINSAFSLKKYSNKYDVSLISSIGEWKNYESDLYKKKIDIIRLSRIDLIDNLPQEGFFLSRFSFIFIFIYFFFPLLKKIKFQKPDVLIIHLLTSLPLILFLIFNITKTKLILRISGFPNLNIFRKLFWKLSNRVIYKIICPTTETLNYLSEKNLFDKNKLILIEDPAININEINILKKEKIDNHIFDVNNSLVAVGRLTEQKNFKFLINVFKEINMTYPKYKLFILGEGEQKKELTTLIEELNLNKNIKLLGYKDNIFKYMFNSKFLISVSHYEDPGFSLLEAAACNLSIISSNVQSGPIDFLLNYNAGYLYKKNNNVDFLRVFTEANTHEDKRLERILNAKKRLKYYTKFHHFLKLNKILLCI
jgi:glycosyltransferase involved in cell wall biosynthesis